MNITWSNWDEYLAIAVIGFVAGRLVRRLATRPTTPDRHQPEDTCQCHRIDPTSGPAPAPSARPDSTPRPR